MISNIEDNKSKIKTISNENFLPYMSVKFPLGTSKIIVTKLATSNNIPISKKVNPKSLKNNICITSQDKDKAKIKYKNCIKKIFVLKEVL